jgi:hypothetical protein
MADNEVKAKDIKSLLLRVYRKYHFGTISQLQAYRETYLLNALLKAIEVADLEERVEKLENINIINLGGGVRP